MKKYVILFIAIVLPIALYSQGNNDIENEKAAIIAVIEQESNAYLNADYESWKDTYVQNDPFIRLNSGANGYSGSNDWHMYDSTFNAYYKSNPEPLTVKFEFEDYIIRIINPESAWAVYTQRTFDSEGTQAGWSIQTRFLEKQNGKWKLNYVSQVSASSYETETVEE